MTNQPVIACVVGTRPEVIKMAPVVLALRQAGWAQTPIVATAQHRDLADDPLRLFGLEPEFDLDLMRPNQDLPGLTARLITGLDYAFEQLRPDLVLAQGDTTSVFTAALAAFYRRIPFGHVEAGLRTGDLMNPFPEEANRALAGRLARIHFAPTDSARRNLLAEGVAEARIHVTGNTVIDALHWMADRVEPRPNAGRRLILVTAHRRESFDGGIEAICRALKDLTARFPEVEILYPVHPNPNVLEPVRRELAGEERIEISPPLAYSELVAAMKSAHLILTDSGGIQEEAPALGVPVLVLRRETERPEAVEAGVAKLVGPDRERIVAEATRLLTDEAAHAAMAQGASPYGDGRAAGRIEQLCRNFLGVEA